jgi:hypothetical protein
MAVDSANNCPEFGAAAANMRRMGPRLGARKINMAPVSVIILEARRAVLTVATALVAPTVASAVIISGMIAVIHGGAASSDNYSSYWTTTKLKKSGKLVPIKKVVRARTDEQPAARAPARADLPSEIYAVTCGVESASSGGVACPVDWRVFLVGLPSFELHLGSTMGRGNINQQLGG